MVASEAKKLACFFKKPARIKKNKDYVLVQMAHDNQSTQSLSGGKTKPNMLDDEIQFVFSGASGGTNGTSTSGGQIPRIYYHVPPSEHVLDEAEDMEIETLNPEENVASLRKSKSKKQGPSAGALAFVSTLDSDTLADVPRTADDGGGPIQAARVAVTQAYVAWVHRRANTLGRLAFVVGQVLAATEDEVSQLVL